MTTFDPDQALAAYIGLHDEQAQEVDQRPDLLRRMERGDYDCMVDAEVGKGSIVGKGINCTQTH